MSALSLVCGQCGLQLKSVKEAQEHGELSGHTQFEESTEPVSIPYSILRTPGYALRASCPTHACMHALCLSARNSAVRSRQCSIKACTCTLALHQASR